MGGIGNGWYQIFPGSVPGKGVGQGPTADRLLLTRNADRTQKHQSKDRGPAPVGVQNKAKTLRQILLPTKQITISQPIPKFE